MVYTTYSRLTGVVEISTYCISEAMVGSHITALSKDGSFIAHEHMNTTALQILNKTITI